VGDAVITGVGLDVIINADAAVAPLGDDVRLDRQRFQRRAIELFEQLPTRCAEPSDRTLFIEQRQQFADRHVDVGEAVKCPVTKPPEKPSLDDELVWPLPADMTDGGPEGHFTRLLAISRVRNTS
jgi:hypothetical protein